MNPNELKAILKDYESHIGDPLDVDSPRVAAVKQAIDRLPQPERIIFILHIDGLSFRELGILLKVSKKTVWKYYNNILANIRRELKEKGL
ncbi:MAG: hypothetical protein IJP93_03145 [Bacteroidales bacterium]|nr:hypothetical protein [Bacteroidales bacterium]